MKKTLFFMLILAIMATGCKKKKSDALNYSDANPIVMVMSGPEHQQGVPAHYYDHLIRVTSDYDITFRAINPDNLSVLSVSSDGYIHGINIGSGTVRISNGHEDLNVGVRVIYFDEPSYNFGCNQSEIKNRFGNPYDQGWLDGDTIYCIRYTAGPGYSYTCGEMVFLFYNGGYYEADLFIKKFGQTQAQDVLLSRYLTENFNHYSTIADTLEVYKYKNDTTIICCVYDTHNQYREWGLIYYRSELTNSLENVLKSLPRSSKLRY